MFCAEIVFVVELILLALGYGLYIMAAKQNNFAKTLGASISWFIMASSLILIITTIFFTFSDGRVITPFGKYYHPMNPMNEQQLKNRDFMIEQMEDTDKKSDKEPDDDENEAEAKSVTTGGACRIQ